MMWCCRARELEAGLETVAIKRLLPLHSEVLDCLVSVLQGRQFVHCHAFTPYNYYLHFECILDASRRPVAFVNEGKPLGDQPLISKDFVSYSLPSGHQRVAVIVLWETNFCENFPQLTGYQLLKNRHLEILGYKLVLVPFFEWNSMKLSERKTKEEFLHAKIFGPS
ncbi:FAST kinase domain-containing protein 1, mitochondrial [Ixodes scapularis]